MPDDRKYEYRKHDKKQKIRYEFIIILVIVIAGFGFIALNNSGITGFAVAGSSGAGGGRPAQCSYFCGSPCWIGGDFISSQGKIGVRDCKSDCITISSYVNELHCCSHLECPVDKPFCSLDGKCITK